MFCGIDIGTSGIKALAIDETGAVLAEASAPLEVSRPREGWSEQNPEQWWKAAGEAVCALPADIRGAVRGIGLSGQMHGATFLDAHDRVLRPAILWNDTRSHAECAELEAREPHTRRITGNLMMPGFTAPKAAWVAKHEPHVFAATQKVILPKDCVRLRMTGNYASDMSDASGTMWLDVSKRDWSEPMLDACGLDRSHMPSLVEGPQITGELRHDVASAWGMPRVPVVGGAGDNAAGAIGVGVLGEGQALVSLGTSGVVFAGGDAFRPDPASGVHAFCHALPGLWHQMSVMLSASSCLDWAARLTGLGDAPALIAAAQTASPQSKVIFLPYLSGERTPHNDPHARGVFFGMDHDTSPATLAQAVLEGVAFGLAEGVAALENAKNLREITVIGGGARSNYWGEIIAAALDTDCVYRKNAAFGPALGAARLALLGITQGSMAEICAPPPEMHRIGPDPALRSHLDDKQARFADLYAALARLFAPAGEHS